VLDERPTTLSDSPVKMLLFLAHYDRKTRAATPVINNDMLVIIIIIIIIVIVYFV